jgi:hypothetical protein
MKRCFIAFLVLLHNVSFCQQKEAYVLHENKDYKFNILCPDKWEINENINEVVPFFFESPRDNENDFFRENVNAVVEISIGYTLNQYVDALVSRLSSKLDNFKLHARAVSSDNSLSPVWIIYDNAKGDLPLKFLSYFYKVDGNIFIITGSAKIEEFERYLPTFDVVCNSFKLISLSSVPPTKKSR